MSYGGVRVGPLVAFAFALTGVPALAHRVQKRFPVASHPVLTVHNASGSVIVRTWDNPVIEVVGTYKSQKVEVSAQKKGNMVLVATHILTDDVTPTDLETDYLITVPRETEISIHNDSGHVQAQGILGATTVETVSADVDVDNVTGFVSVRTVGGTFTCNQCSGRIEANSISGGINVIGSQSPNVQARTSTGNVLLDSTLLPNGIYRLRNYSGQIDVLFSPSDSFDVSAISLHGRVDNDASLARPTQPTQHLPSFARSLFGVYNEGRARLVLNSFSGTIVIRRR